MNQKYRSGTVNHNQLNSRMNFETWLIRTKPEWTWNTAHQKAICRALKDAWGTSKRLMVFMPPRHGKSEMVTVRYAAWRLEQRPSTRILICCHTQRLANLFSRKIRRIVAERMKLGRDRSAVNEWETAEGGGVTVIGVGGALAGIGADLVIVDDPIRNRSDAESQNIRESVYDWFCDDVHTRFEPGAMAVLIQTRWHNDDLAGRLLKDAGCGGEQWSILSLAALAEEDDLLGRSFGTALWPERFSRDVLLAKQRQLGSYSFASLYQQRPVPREGALFKPAFFAGKIIAQAPDGMTWFRGYDLAVSTLTSADYTASFRVAADRDGNLYIADGFRKRIEFPEQRRFVVECILAEKNTVHGIESALHGRAFVQELLRDTRLTSSVFRSVNVDKDKYTRALAWANRAENGKVFLVNGPWIDDFLDEAYNFPAGRHDDQVDAVSLAVQMIGANRRRTAGF